MSLATRISFEEDLVFKIFNRDLNDLHVFHANE